VKTEDDPLDPTPPATTRETNAAMRDLDQAVTNAGGIALRYGGFYGAPNDGLIEPVRKRQFPTVGKGGGVFSFIHRDDAAAATVLALEHGAAGIYNIVDDDPAPIREWLPVLANVLGAKPPRHFPRWLARLFAGPSRRRDGNRVPRRVQREGQTRTRLDAVLPTRTPTNSRPKQSPHLPEQARTRHGSDRSHTTACSGTTRSAAAGG